MTQLPQQHCDHECVCGDYAIVMFDEDIENKESCNIAYCEHDTRPHTPAAPATERLGFTEFCYVHCDKHECCTNECERSAYNAAKAEREHAAKKIDDFADHLRDIESLVIRAGLKELAESLRGGA